MHSFKLLKTDFNYDTVSISKEEGEFLTKQIKDNGYSKAIEIGCALGMSSLYICDGLKNQKSASIHIIDPHQEKEFKNNGLKNLSNNGFNFYKVHNDYSELILPELLRKGEVFDFAFIDGWHSFDHCLIDFFYLNRLIKVGGMIVFDDSNWPAINKVINYVNNYPNYELISPIKVQDQGLKNMLSLQIIKLTKLFSKIYPSFLRKRIFSSLIQNPEYLYVKQRWTAFKKLGKMNAIGVGL